MSSPSESPPLRLLDQVRELIRIRHYSIRTEQAYVQWIKRFILFHGKRHPREMGAEELTAFLSDLAVCRHVSASTQNQALHAVLFLYRDVLKMDLPWLNEVQRAKKPQHLPVVFTREEVRALLAQLDGTMWLMAALAYGGGLRLLECLRLRVKDVPAANASCARSSLTRSRSRGWLRPRLSSLRSRGKVSERRSRVGLAVRLSFQATVDRPTLRRRAPTPRPGRCVATGSEARDPAGAHREARQRPYPAAFLRHASTGIRLRHPHSAGATGSCGREDDDDLHACP
jgi:integrase